MFTYSFVVKGKFRALSSRLKPRVCVCVCEIWVCCVFWKMESLTNALIELLYISLNVAADRDTITVPLVSSQR